MNTLLLHPELESIAVKAIVDMIQQPPARSMIQNEQHLHRLLSGLPAAIYLTDARGRITFYNEAAAALWGCRPRLNNDQWCGSWRLHRPDGTPLPHDQCPMAVALRERRTIVGEEAVAQRPDGTRVSFVAYPSPLWDSSGALVGAINMLVDITERRHAEQFRLRLASIVESSDDAIVSKDLNGIIATWNRGAERIFGYTADEMIFKPIATLIPPERQDEEPLILKRIQRGERVDHYETIRRRKDGSLIEISLTVSPVRDANGRIVGASKIARDISEHKRKERHIALLAREVDHRSKNLLALVLAAVRLTEADTAEELKVAIEGRLAALSNAHALLTQSRWEGADLRELSRKSSALTAAKAINVRRSPAPMSRWSPRQRSPSRSSCMSSRPMPSNMARCRSRPATCTLSGGIRLKAAWSCVGPRPEGPPLRHPHAVGSAPMSPTDWCAVNSGAKCASIGARRDSCAKSTFPKTPRRARLRLRARWERRSPWSRRACPTQRLEGAFFCEKRFHGIVECR